MEVVICRQRCVHLVVVQVPAIVTFVHEEYEILTWHAPELKSSILVCLGLQDYAVRVLCDAVLLQFHLHASAVFLVDAGYISCECLIELIDPYVGDSIVCDESKAATFAAILEVNTDLILHTVNIKSPKTKLGGEAVLAILIHCCIPLRHEPVEDAWRVPSFFFERIRLLQAAYGSGSCR